MRRARSESSSVKKTRWANLVAHKLASDLVELQAHTLCKHLTGVEHAKLALADHQPSLSLNGWPSSLTQKYTDQSLALINAHAS